MGEGRGHWCVGSRSGYYFALGGQLHLSMDAAASVVPRGCTSAEIIVVVDLWGRSSSAGSMDNANAIFGLRQISGYAARFDDVSHSPL